MLRTRTMSPEDFHRYADAHPDVRFDFMDGELVEVSPKPLHGRLQAKLAALFINWLEANPVGVVHTETLHVLNGEKFIPDVSINPTAADDHAYFGAQPLLVVEVRSDTQSREAQRRKALRYLSHDVPAVLVVMPDEQIELFTPQTGDSPLVYKAGQVVGNIPGCDGLTIDVDGALG